MVGGRDGLSGELTTGRQSDVGVRTGRSRRERLFALWWAMFALIMVLTVLPAGWGFGGWPVLLQMVSFPFAFGITLLLVAVVLAVRTVRTARTSYRRSGLRWLAVAVIAVVGVNQVGTTVSRGWWADGSAAQRGDLVVISFNSAGIEPLPAELADLLVTYHPQIVSLPETTREMADQLATGARRSGLEYQVFRARTVSAPPSITSLLVSTTLGVYHLDRERSLADGVVRVIPESGNGPVIVAVHPTSPAVIGLQAASWRSAGLSAVDQCISTPGSIVAGDFNANLSNPQFSDLGPCLDTASAMHRSGEGTWPAWLPAPFASAIDHVLVDGGSWQVVNFRTLTVGDSDHRLVITTIRSR